MVNCVIYGDYHSNIIIILIGYCHLNNLEISRDSTLLNLFIYDRLIRYLHLLHILKFMGIPITFINSYTILYSIIHILVTEYLELLKCTNLPYSYYIQGTYFNDLPINQFISLKVASPYTILKWKTLPIHFLTFKRKCILKAFILS